MADLLQKTKEDRNSALRQKDKISWLTMGVENTNFFHQSIKHRHKANTINTSHQHEYCYKGPILTAAQQNLLPLSFSKAEIKKALWSIPEDKAPALMGSIVASTKLIGRCITKLICSRLKPVLEAIISSNQSPFVEGRSILYNILLCQDVVKRYGRRSCMPSCLI
ncbi:uncharacterized protein LOC130805719 [Amaranthus tricolor]|uniref:uncharacterized protein LOC130805719 n=1 Tax=Amaranthus tricolor TaxID=29722 RepID=UPI00258962EB|nr:uncharacterized protein LOC130805719 [Amaranthus tricolor]